MPLEKEYSTGWFILKFDHFQDFSNLYLKVNDIFNLSIAHKLCK